MKNIKINSIKKKIYLECNFISPDKSISHRAVIFSFLSNKKSIIKNFLLAEDTISTLNIAKQLGATILQNGSEIEISPPLTINEPKDILNCNNSGTGMRLYIGFLAGLNKRTFVLNGDKYLNSRPMGRITKPLIEIGANIDGRENGKFAPIFIRGEKLKSFRYESKINSAQVKSAMILAALQIKDSKNYYKENLLSRDHSERMLRGMGANINLQEDGWIEINSLRKPLNPIYIQIPSDPSSGFFFAVAGAIIPNSEVIIKNITLNPTRVEAYKILELMGVEVNFIEKENIYEPIGNIQIKSPKKLKAVKIEKNIAWLIDELPALAIAMAMAEGNSIVKNAEELRKKESDRISTVLEGLNKCGINTEEYLDGYKIIGGKIKSATINSYGDHRIAMSFAIAGLISDMIIQDIECINTSFPNYFDILLNI